MFNEEEIFGKQIELAESIFESTVTNIENMDSISFMESVMDEDLYMESEKTEKIKENLKKFFESIKNAIKDFFERITIMIKGKIEDAKIKKAINDIKKSGIKNLNKIKVKGFKDDEMYLKYTKKAVSICASYTKKIMIEKKAEKIEKYSKECAEELNQLNNDFADTLAKATVVIDVFTDSLGMESNMATMTNITNETLDKMNKMLWEKEELGHKEEQVVQDTEKLEEVREAQQASRQAFKGIASAFSRTIKKIGSAMTTTQGKIISSIVAAAAIAAGTTKAGMTIKNKNVNESVDDIFDSLLEDIGV